MKFRYLKIYATALFLILEMNAKSLVFVLRKIEKNLNSFSLLNVFKMKM